VLSGPRIRKPINNEKLLPIKEAMTGSNIELWYGDVCAFFANLHLPQVGPLLFIREPCGQFPEREHWSKRPIFPVSQLEQHNTHQKY
jgi:hypothetical protein